VHLQEFNDPLLSLRSNSEYINQPLGYLDSLQLTDRRAAHQLRIGLLALQPYQLIEDFGIDAGLWAVLTTDDTKDHELYDILEDQYGYDTHALEVARNWKLRQRGKEDHTSAQTIHELYLLRRNLQESLDRIDLPSIIAANALEGINVDSTRANAYSLQAVATDNFNNETCGGEISIGYMDRRKNVEYSIWLDATVGYILEYKSRPNAIVGLDYSGPNELIIRQLQGIRGNRVDPSKFGSERKIGSTSARGLIILDWRKLLIDITERVAEGLDISSLAVASGRNNHWTSVLPHESVAHLTQEQAYLAYDKTAQRLGFTQQSSDEQGNWHRKTSNPRSDKRDRYEVI
jgi:hypothetical protein